MSTPKKVAIIGSGNWGSAIARIVGSNVCKHDDLFDKVVPMYVFEEMVDGRKLTEIINTDHENVKYLPGHKIPDNVIAVPDVYECAKDADIMIWVLPHQFVRRTCGPLVGKIKSSAVALTLIKGFDMPPSGGIELISEVLHTMLNIEVSVLMGANLAGEVAEGQFCESTLGCKNLDTGNVLKKLVQTDYFRIAVIDDVSTIEICGSLKNIVAVAAGFCDGLGFGGNTKAAIMRIGLLEMVLYAKTFYPGAKMDTFFESCGVADLITTCYGGRNRRLSEAFVKTGKTFADLEKEMLNGQRLQGPQTAEEVYSMLEQKGVTEKFPLFVGVHLISTGQLPPSKIIDYARQHD